MSAKRIVAEAKRGKSVLPSKKALQQKRAKTSDEKERAGHMHSLGALCVEDGDIKGGQELLREAWEIRKGLLGENHRDTLWSMSGLGGVHKILGEFEEAEKLLAECLKKQRKDLGDDDEHTLHTMCELGALYGLDLQRLEEGEGMLKQCIEKAKEALGAG